MNTDEGKKLANIVFQVILLLTVVAAVITIFTLISIYSNKELTRSEDTLNSVSMEKVIGLEMQQDPVLCTMVANALQDFDDADLGYVHVIDNTVHPAERYLYTYSDYGLTGATSGAYIDSSNYPIDNAVAKLLQYSNRRCSIELIQDSGSGLYGVQVVIMDD